MASFSVVNFALFIRVSKWNLRLCCPDRKRFAFSGSFFNIRLFSTPMQIKKNDNKILTLNTTMWLLLAIVGYFECH